MRAAAAANPPMPDYIQVGPYRYAVSADAHTVLHHSAADGTFRAETDIDRKLMRVNPVYAEEMPVSLLHEVLHGICDAVGWRDREEKVDAETAIRRLCPLLTDTLRRNPAIVEYLVCRWFQPET